MDEGTERDPGVTLGSSVAGAAADPEGPGRKRTWLTLVGIVAVLAVAAWLYFLSGIAAAPRTQCTVHTSGGGSCRFTNDGWGFGGECVTVELTNPATGRSAATPTVCSGSLGPGGSSTQEFSLAAGLGDLCPGPDWRKVCQVEVREAE